MEIILILLLLIVFTMYFAPYLFESLQALSYRFYSIFAIKNTLLFGIVAMLFSIRIEPFPITTVFLGMIAGSLVDIIMNQNKQ